MKADGVLYKKHCVVVKEVDELPVFVLVEELFVKDSSLYFITETCESVFFSDHFHAFVFVPTNSYFILHVSELEEPIPLHARKISGLTRGNQFAVVAKHHLSTLYVIVTGIYGSKQTKSEGEV